LRTAQIWERTGRAEGVVNTLDRTGSAMSSASFRGLANPLGGDKVSSRFKTLDDSGRFSR